MDTPTILNKAAEVIEERGWMQGASQDPFGTAVCAMAALRIARGLPPLPMGDEDTTSVEEVDAAADEFERHVIAEFDVVNWNDRVATSAEQVTTALRECAAELSKETTR